MEMGRVVKGNEADDARRVAANQVPTSLSQTPSHTLIASTHVTQPSAQES